MALLDIPPPTERAAAAQALLRQRWLRTRWILSAPSLAIIVLFGILPLLIMEIGRAHV